MKSIWRIPEWEWRNYWKLMEWKYGPATTTQSTQSTNQFTNQTQSIKCLWLNWLFDCDWCWWLNGLCCWPPHKSTKLICPAAFINWFHQFLHSQTNAARPAASPIHPFFPFSKRRMEWIVGFAGGRGLKVISFINQTFIYWFHSKIFIPSINSVWFYIMR